MRRLTATMTAVLCAISCASSPTDTLTAQLGELPPDAVNVVDIDNVRTELCRRIVFRPEAIGTTMPEGLRLRQLSEMSNRPWVADLLRDRPQYAGFGRGSLCFVEARYAVNGVPIHRGARTQVVFLWADIVRTESAPADPRQRGPLSRAQLLFFYDENVDRSLALAATPNAIFGRINVDRRGAAWLVRLEAQGGVLSGRILPDEPGRALDYETPAWETVPLTDRARDHFTVVTFAGHHEAGGQASWLSFGSAGWLRLFEQDSRVDLGSFIQDGWIARSALYRVSEHDSQPP